LPLQADAGNTGPREPVVFAELTVSPPQAGTAARETPRRVASAGAASAPPHAAEGGPNYKAFRRKGEGTAGAAAAAAAAREAAVKVPLEVYAEARQGGADAQAFAK
jgi:hypothetical protein